MARLNPFRSVAVLAVSVVAAVSTRAPAAVLTGPVVNPGKGYSYFLLTESSWTANQAEAMAPGGHLATVRDAAENPRIFATFGAFGGIDRNLWIGLKDVATPDTFVRVSGEPLSNTNRHTGEPNNNFQGQPEAFVHLWAANQGFDRTPGSCNDIIDDPNPVRTSVQMPAAFHGVVEVIPEPGALAFLVPTALLLRRRAR